MDVQQQCNIIDINNENDEFIQDFHRIINDPTVVDADDEDVENWKKDPYLNMELGLPRGDDAGMLHATVKKRAVDVDGKPVGVAHSNPLLDTRKYEVEYIDGMTEILSANIIAENLLAQVDEEGHRQMLFDEIINHRTNAHTIPKH